MSEIDDSYVVRKLTSKEIKNLKKEIKSNNKLWVPHLSRKHLTALKDGKSIHLKYKPIPGINVDHWNKFPNTVKIIEEIANGKPSERTYWHRLLNNDTIEKHHDKYIGYVLRKEIFARYQIYLDIPKDCYLDIDNVVIEDTSVFSNSIIKFNLRKYHEYKNNSIHPWYFLVFDIMKD